MNIVALFFMFIVMFGITKMGTKAFIGGFL